MKSKKLKSGKKALKKNITAKFSELLHILGHDTLLIKKELEKAGKSIASKLSKKAKKDKLAADSKSKTVAKKQPKTTEKKSSAEKENKVVVPAKTIQKPAAPKTPKVSEKKAESPKSANVTKSPKPTGSGKKSSPKQ